MVHLIDTDLLRAVGIAESECVESRAEDDDLLDSAFDGFGQGVFRDAASRGGEEATDAGCGVSVRKLNHIVFIFAQNFRGEWVIED
jgi:hypothetical protein